MAASPIEVRLERAMVALEDHGRRLADLEHAKPAVLASEIQQLRADIFQLREDIQQIRVQMVADKREMTEELKSNRRGLWAVALAVLAGAVSFAFTALTIWGGAS